MWNRKAWQLYWTIIFNTYRENKDGIYIRKIGKFAPVKQIVNLLHKYGNVESKSVAFKEIAITLRNDVNSPFPFDDSRDISTGG